MPPHYYHNADFDTTWQTIEAGVRQTLQNASGSDHLDMKDSMTLSTAIHKFCMGRCAGCSKPTQGYTRGNRGEAYLLGKELYGRLKQSLRNYLQGIQDEADQHLNETLIGFYMEEWDQYVTAARSNNHLFKYLNQSWVKREIDEGKKNVYDVYTLHVVVWKEVVVAATSADIADALVQFIETLR